VKVKKQGILGQKTSKHYMADKATPTSKVKKPQKKGNTKVTFTDHKKTLVWQSIDDLDTIVQDLFKKVPRNEYKIHSQIDNAFDSTGANFVEGYYSGFLPEYIRFLTFSRRSLGELQERVRCILRKGYIGQDEYKVIDERAGKTMYLLNRLICSLKEKKDSKD
jgi:four helix bundle protein